MLCALSFGLICILLSLLTLHVSSHVLAVNVSLCGMAAWALAFEHSVTVSASWPDSCTMYSQIVQRNNTRISLWAPSGCIQQNMFSYSHIYSELQQAQAVYLVRRLAFLIYRLRLRCSCPRLGSSLLALPSPLAAAIKFK